MLQKLFYQVGDDYVMYFNKSGLRDIVEKKVLEEKNYIVANAKLTNFSEEG